MQSRCTAKEVIGPRFPCFLGDNLLKIFKVKDREIEEKVCHSFLPHDCRHRVWLLDCSISPVGALVRGFCTSQASESGGHAEMIFFKFEVHSQAGYRPSQS